MKLLDVTIHNFMAISEAQVKLADRGLVLVQGDNQDESSATSNGAGKSSFADALCWCLYGTTARGEEGDKVVNRFVGKNCSVTVTVEDGPDDYLITRYRKHKTHKNQLKVKRAKRGVEAWGDLTKGTEKLTQEVINQIIGCSFDVFTGAVYAGQERMPDLPGMTDKTLKMLIEEASGATLLEAAYGEANTRLRMIKAEVEASDELRVRVQILVEENETRLKDANDGKITFERDRLVAVKIIHAKATVIKSQYDTLKVKVDAGDREADLKHGIKALDDAIAAVESERKTEKTILGRLSTLQTRLAAADATISNLAANAKLDIQSLAKVEHRVGCPCETCARPYTAADIAPAKKLAELRVADSKLTYERAKESRGVYAADAARVTDALEKHRASMTDVSKTSAQRASLQTRLDAVTKANAALYALHVEVRAAIGQIKAKKAETNPFIHRIEAAEKETTLLAFSLKEREAELAAAIAKLKVQETVAKVFSPAGVRAFLLDEVTPFLNDQTAKYLGTLSDDHITATWTTLIKSAKGELREKFSIEVVNSTGGDSFGLISGGEKRKVRIACALALQDLVARRATKPIELFIGDEIDDALDPAGIERLTAILEEKAKERGSVFIISHSDLKCWVRNTITITKKGEMATIEEGVA